MPIFTNIYGRIVWQYFRHVGQLLLFEVDLSLPHKTCLQSPKSPAQAEEKAHTGCTSLSNRKPPNKCLFYHYDLYERKKRYFKRSGNWNDYRLMATRNPINTKLTNLKER